MVELILMTKMLLPACTAGVVASWRDRSEESKIPLLHCLDASSCCFMACSLHRVCWSLSGGWDCLSVLDFAGSNLVSVDSFAYGSIARYLQLDRKKCCCFPVNLAAHVCERSYKHAEAGTAISWDDALQLGVRHFEHKFYNLLTCNCYSFVANCLNRLAYNGSVKWNVLNVAALVWLHGQWVD